MKRSASRAFTLIELLIVIAIICIIAAILFPVFQSARERARASMCMSNMSQIGKALMEYSQDNNDSYPYGLLVNGTATNNPAGSYNSSLNGFFIGGTAWGGVVYPYVRATGPFSCPSDPTQLSSAAAAANATVVSYAFNSNIGGASRHRLVSPSTTVLLAEVQGAQAQVTDPTEGTSGYTKIPTTKMLSPTTDGYYTTSTIEGRTGFVSDAWMGMTPTLFWSGKGWTAGVIEIQAAPTYTLPAIFDPNVKLATGYVGFRGVTMQRAAWPPLDSNKQTGFTALQGRHLGGANYICADGHAKWLLPVAVSSGLNQVNIGCPQDYYQNPCVVDNGGSDPYAQSQNNLGSYTLSFSML